MMAGRRRDPAKERHWRQVIRQWKQSGLSVREFCDWQGVSEASLYAWRRELADRDPPSGGASSKARSELSPAGQFVPVRVLADTPFPGESSPVLEVLLPSGVRLRVPAGCTRQTLADVIAVLESRPC
jgi:transposase-like protein